MKKKDREGKEETQDQKNLYIVSLFATVWHGPRLTLIVKRKTQEQHTNSFLFHPHKETR